MLRKGYEHRTSARNPVGLASNILLAVGAGIGLYVLAKAYLFSGGIPAGACPLTLARPWLYASIALLLLSLIVSLFEPKKGRPQPPTGDRQ